MKKQEGTVMEKEKDVWSFKTSDLVTIPNIITYVRFVLIIPFVYFFLAEQYIYAAICIGLSGLSDCFDGMAARKLNQVTPLGKILDPIADKVTLFAVVICMVIYVPMVLPILVTLLVKDLIMLLGGADLIKKKTHSAFCKLVRKGRNNYFLLFRMPYRISQGLFCLRKIWCLI